MENRSDIVQFAPSGRARPTIRPGEAVPRDLFAPLREAVVYLQEQREAEQEQALQDEADRMLQTLGVTLQRRAPTPARPLPDLLMGDADRQIVPMPPVPVPDARTAEDRVAAHLVALATGADRDATSLTDDPGEAALDAAARELLASLGYSTAEAEESTR